MHKKESKIALTLPAAKPGTFYPSLTSMESEKQPQRRLINRCKVNVDFATPKKVVGRKGQKRSNWYMGVVKIYVDLGVFLPHIHPCLS